MKQFILFLLLFSSTFCFSQQVKVTPAIKKQISDYLQAEMKKEQIPGLSYAIVSNGKIIDSGAYGYADVELKAPVTSHTLFNIGSIGKTFTATAIMLLQKQGKLSIDDPINKYLDSLPDSWKDITIRNLLTHTSGIRDYTPDFPTYPIIAVDRKQEISEADYIHMVTAAPLNFPPGERWAYSNSNFDLLGFIIHKLAGEPTGDFMKEKIFQLAKLNETRYTNVREIIPNRAKGYLLDDNNKLIHGKYISNFFSTMGDMGVITTATDLARWSIAQDLATVLDSQTLNMMWTPSKLNNGMESMAIVWGNYGMGWFLTDHRGFKQIGHGGSFANGYEAELSRFPEKKFAVTVLVNLNPSDVGSIGNHLAGFYDPQLDAIYHLTVEKNADSSFNKNVRAFIKSLGTGNYDSSFVTESYIQRVNPATRIMFGRITEPQLSFIRSDKISAKKLERYGSSISRINYYKIMMGGETHYLAIYLTAENKIADTRGY